MLIVSRRREFVFVVVLFNRLLRQKAYVSTVLCHVGQCCPAV